MSNNTHLEANFYLPLTLSYRNSTVLQTSCYHANLYNLAVNMYIVQSFNILYNLLAEL
jgi:hypothetical protein